MRLSECADLLAAAFAPSPDSAADPDVAGVCLDSRTARAGEIFVAVAGAREDGRRFAADAVRRGAVAVVAREPVDGLAVPALIVADARRAAGLLADAFAGHPSRKLRLMGVTGTNGKTTTAYLLRHIFNRCGERCGMLGTIEYDDGRAAVPAPLTTPDPVAFAGALADMVRHGCHAAAVEVSSHALDQGRVRPHRFAAAVFTNLTRDHLDYHGDMDAYAAAKARLFAGLDPDAVAVLNADDPAAAIMARAAQAAGARVLAFTIADNADGVARPGHPDAFWSVPDDRVALWRARIDRLDLEGAQGVLTAPDGASLAWRSPLAGRFNVANALGSLIAALALELPPAWALAALADFPGVPGRLERIVLPGGALAFVDYAHTDDALRTVLRTLRALAGTGRLTVVFGCGGDRDRGKRPLMARAAAENADAVVVTGDNPRTEDPAQIFADIRAGFADAPAVPVVYEPDRAAAVTAAVSRQGPGDVLLVAGKGHEDYQIVGTTRRPLDDRALLRAAATR